MKISSVEDIERALETISLQPWVDTQREAKHFTVTTTLLSINNRMMP